MWSSHEHCPKNLTSNTLNSYTGLMFIKSRVVPNKRVGLSAYPRGWVTTRRLGYRQYLQKFADIVTKDNLR
ncbi:hypothetical protein, partial [Fodinibius sediminis]